MSIQEQRAPEEKATDAYPNAKQMAFPVQASDAAGSLYAESGLTKREYIAAVVLAGIMAAAAQQRHIPTVAGDAVRLADALLEELEK